MMDSNPTNACTQVGGWNGLAAILATKRSAGVTPEVNLRNLLCAGSVVRQKGFMSSKHIFKTRMHSSRMHTARLLPVSPSMHCSLGGVPGWVYLPGGVTVQGVYLPRGCTCPGGVPAQGRVYLPGGTCPGTPPVDRHNLRKLHLRAVKIVDLCRFNR